MNKTGTTSLKKAFHELGFSVGSQRRAEKLSSYYHKRDFEPIIKYCKTAIVFQDVPFSWPETYIHLDKAFPNAKFILSIRDSAEIWYNSVLKFNTNKNGRLPNARDLKNSNYVYKGWHWENYQSRFGGDVNKIWDKKMRISDYNNHNKSVMEYFKDKPGKLLVINLSDKDAYNKFCDFIGVNSDKDNFPWVNKSNDINLKN